MVKLQNEDFTITKIIEYVLYSTHFEGDKLLDYCASSRQHPHIPLSLIKLHFTKDVDEELISQLINSACESAIPVFQYIYKTFATKE